MTFQLHPRLQQDSETIGKFSLSRLLLINDSQYPWFVLVPERIDITEIHQLSLTDQHQLLKESSLLSKTLETLYHADKMNIAAIGNLVPQLHLHHVVRYQNDIAWPAPIWGKYDTVPYSEQQLQQTISQIRIQFKNDLVVLTQP